MKAKYFSACTCDASFQSISTPGGACGGVTFAFGGWSFGCTRVLFGGAGTCGIVPSATITRRTALEKPSTAVLLLLLGGGGRIVARSSARLIGLAFAVGSNIGGLGTGAGGLTASWGSG